MPLSFEERKELRKKIDAELRKKFRLVKAETPEERLLRLRGFREKYPHKPVPGYDLISDSTVRCTDCGKECNKYVNRKHRHHPNCVRLVSPNNST